MTHHSRRSAGLTIALVLVAGAALAAPSQADPPPSDPVARAISQAAATGQEVEIAEWTDEYDQFVANADGTLSFTTHREAVRTKRNGAWRAIDTTVTLQPDGKLRPVATTIDMAFSAGGGHELVTTSVDGQSLTINTPFVLTPGSVEGSEITYPNVMPDVDLVVSVGAESFSQVLVVKNRDAAENPELANLEYTIETENLNYSVNDDGSAQAISADGDIVLQSGTPVMWDSTNSPQAGEKPSATAVGDTITPIDLSVSATGDPETVDITLTPDAEELHGADVTYPVFIDPTLTRNQNSFVVVREGLTSYTQDHNPDDFRIGYCNWAGCSPAYRARSYFDFNIEALNKVSGGTVGVVTQAVVNLAQTHAASSAPTPVSLNAVNGSFGAWTPWPGPLDYTLGTVSTSSSGPFNISFSVKDYVNVHVRDQRDFVGFALRANNESDPYNWKKFNNNPSLNITFAFPTGVPTLPVVRPTTPGCGPYVTSNTVNLTSSAAVYGPEPKPNVIIVYEVYKAGTSTLAVPPINSAAVASGQSGARSVNLGVGSYYVKAYSYPNITDGKVWKSTYTAPVTFHVVPTQPQQPEVWSFAHPAGSRTADGMFEGAEFTDARSALGTIKIKSADPAIGFAYAWDGTLESTGSCTISNSSSDSVRGVVAATNGAAALSIPATPSLRDGQTATLRVKTIGPTGTMSDATTTYRFNINPAGAIVQSVEAESVAVTGYTMVPDAKASGGQRMQVTGQSGTTITFKFSAPAGKTWWMVQPDFILPANAGVRYVLNGRLIGGSVNGQMQLDCGPLTAQGNGQIQNLKIEPRVCSDDSSSLLYVPMVAGDSNRFSIILQGPATIRLDKIRFIQASPPGPFVDDTP